MTSILNARWRTVTTGTTSARLPSGRRRNDRSARVARPAGYADGAVTIRLRRLLCWQLACLVGGCWRAATSDTLRNLSMATPNSSIGARPATQMAGFMSGKNIQVVAECNHLISASCHHCTLRSVQIIERRPSRHAPGCGGCSRPRLR